MGCNSNVYYLILNSRVNSNLKNRPVYEKIEIIEEAIRDNGIDYVIPSKRSQLHYFVIKEIFHDLSKYPVKELKAETKKSKKKKLLMLLCRLEIWLWQVKM